MEILGLFIALALPWWVGMAWLGRFWKARPGAWPAWLGYGFFAGMLVTAGVMVLVDALGFALNFWVLAALLALLGAGGWRLQGAFPKGGRASLGTWERALFYLFLALLAFRLADLLLEVLWRPLYPWDAWMNWAPKAKVWAALKHLVPFVDRETWLRTEGAYTMENFFYPPFIPLVQTWVALGLGRFDDVLINLPWWQCAIALGCAFYGQLRYGGLGPLSSMAFTYLLLSMPFPDVHVALAGYADLWMGALYGLAAMAFFHAFREPSWRQGLLALFLAIAGTQVKVPGLAWMLTFLPALMVALFPRWGIRALAGLGASLAVILWFFPPHHLPLSWLGLPDIPLGFHPVVWPFLENGFIFDNWHLFWYLALLAMAFLPLRAFSRPLLPLTILFLTASAFIFFVFFLTDRYRFALDYTQINRAVLHVVPLSAFYVAMLMKGRKGA